MNRHVKGWIAAYYDGQLEADRAAQVAEHVQNCTVCQAELEALQALSALLHAAPGPGKVASPQAALSRIWQQSGPPPIHLAGTASHPSQMGRVTGGVQQYWWLAWMAAPFVLIVGWAFWQAVMIVNGLGNVAGFEDILGSIWVPPLSHRSFFDLGMELALETLGRMGLRLEPWTTVLQMLLLQLSAMVSVGVLLGGWLASWWAFTRHRAYAGQIEER